MGKLSCNEQRQRIVDLEAKCEAMEHEHEKLHAQLAAKEAECERLRAMNEEVICRAEKAINQSAEQVWRLQSALRDRGAELTAGLEVRERLRGELAREERLSSLLHDRLAKIREEIAMCSGGDRPPSPPVWKLRLEQELAAILSGRHL